MYRVVVVRKHLERNPDPEGPYWLYDETRPCVNYYGPYPALETARCVQTREAYEPLWMNDGTKVLREEVISTHIEKVQTAWEKHE